LHVAEPCKPELIGQNFQNLASETSVPTANIADFLVGGGEMGALMSGRQIRWAAQNWPQSLRTAVRLLLNTNHPMFIAAHPVL
jgi:hypothetical protein